MRSESRSTKPSLSLPIIRADKIVRPPYRCPTTLPATFHAPHDFTGPTPQKRFEDFQPQGGEKIRKKAELRGSDPVNPRILFQRAIHAGQNDRAGLVFATFFRLFAAESVDECMLIRLPDKRRKNSNKECRKIGKEAWKYILPAFLPSCLPHLNFVRHPDKHG